MPDMGLIAFRACIALVLAAALFIGGCVHGQRMEQGKEAVAQVAEQKADEKRIEHVDAVSEQANTESAQAAVRVITKFQPIEREVIRYVATYSASHPDPVECLDADGLRLWRAANRGEFQAADGASDGSAAVRGAEPDSSPDGREGNEPAGGSRSPDEGLSPVQAAASGAGELDHEGARGAE